MIASNRVTGAPVRRYAGRRMRCDVASPPLPQRRSSVESSPGGSAGSRPPRPTGRPPRRAHSLLDVLTRRGAGVAALAALLLPFVLFSPPARAASPIKLGFVNVAKVLKEAPQAQEARSKIEQEFTPRDQKLLGQQKDIRSLEDKLVRDGDVMNQSQRDKLEQEIRMKKRDLRRAQDEFRDDLNLRRSQVLSKLQQEVIQVIQEVAQQEKYDLIVSDGVIFAAPRVDITDDVIARLKTKFKKEH